MRKSVGTPDILYIVGCRSKRFLTLDRLLCDQKETGEIQAKVEPVPPIMKKYFRSDYDYVRRVDLSMVYWNPERNKSSNTQSNVWSFFFQMEAFVSLKNEWLSPSFFLDTKSTDLLSSVFSA